MSRIGKNPVVVPANVTAQVNDQDVSVKSPKDELSVSVPVPITVKLKDNEIMVDRPGDHRKSRSLHSLSCSLINNMVVGMTEDYTIKMETFGVGYRATKKSKDLEFSLGYSHPVLVGAPEGITFDVGGTTKSSITGTDKQQVGQLAADIRRLHEDDPYKGKGIRYDGEQIRHKIEKTGE